jgi:catechol 2,3-dioxygenase-like lactoylglutathione lyase family enzyme
MTSSPATTQNLALTILLVRDPVRSVEFYRDILGADPAEQSPTFAMFALPSGVAIGLWSSQTVEPAIAGSAGASELCFMEDDVDGVHAAWVERGIPMAQEPTNLDFGRTFVALDPDGHRVRVFRPAADERAA